MIFIYHAYTIHDYVLTYQLPSQYRTLRAGAKQSASWVFTIIALERYILWDLKQKCTFWSVTLSGTWVRVLWIYMVLRELLSTWLDGMTMLLFTTMLKLKTRAHILHPFLIAHCKEWVWTPTHCTHYNNDNFLIGQRTLKSAKLIFTGWTKGTRTGVKCKQSQLCSRKLTLKYGNGSTEVRRKAAYRCQFCALSTTTVCWGLVALVSWQWCRCASVVIVPPRE